WHSQQANDNIGLRQATKSGNVGKPDSIARRKRKLRDPLRGSLHAFRRLPNYAGQVFLYGCPEAIIVHSASAIFSRTSSQMRRDGKLSGEFRSSVQAAL